jgi:hypothetical protein
MLLIGAAGLYLSFLLAIEMCGHTKGTPAFWVPMLMLATPLFYAQSMMAQLDMPAMVLGLAGLLLFFKGRYAWCAVTCTVLVLVKETGIVLPAILAAWLLFREKRWKEALYFLAAPICLAIWLVELKRVSGHWLGDAGFAHYNVNYSLSWVRIFASILRRLFYYFVSDFRWIGTIGILYGLLRTRLFLTREWFIVGSFFVLHTLLVSVFGGAALERYLLPTFPILYIAVATGWSAMKTTARQVSLVASLCGMVAGLFWNPPYPFPYENNLAMVDFIELQKAAADFVQQSLPGTTIATAWPYTAALRAPEYGYVKRPFNTIETGDFHVKNVIEGVKNGKADVVIVYSRTWEPEVSIIRNPIADRFLRKFYEYEPQITAEQLAPYGFHPVLRWPQRGQWIEIFAK